MTHLILVFGPGDLLTTSAVIKSVLEYYPNLQHLAIRDRYRGSLIDENELGNAFATCCHRLIGLCFDAKDMEMPSIPPSRIMVAMLEGQLEELEFMSYGNGLGIEEMRMSLQRHSRSLRRITFSGCALVIAECVALEELGLLPREEYGYSRGNPEDAIAAIPWACTNLRHLDLDVCRSPLPELLSYMTMPVPESSDLTAFPKPVQTGLALQYRFNQETMDTEDYQILLFYPT
ncbi:hypothetical protein BGX33_007071 [Mortierella sp. NVP41]|nr:hypothetical protein BGX33_007071 [Mortierella sp. NVP41]